MGSARHRSWSHTRGKLVDTCMRSLYYAYYPWGDEHQNLAWFLKRAASVDSLAGTVVHRFIVLGLRQFVRRGDYPLGLAKDGVRDYDDLLRESREIGKTALDGKRPPDEGTVLFHHLYGTEDVEAEERGRRIVQTCLENFETSPALEFLKGTNTDKWKRILTNTENVPSFYASPELGFQSAYGLRIYAAYDLALQWGDDLILVDWKTGGRTGRAEWSARRQLVVYALWAMADGWKLENVKVVPYWLAECPRWAPQSLTEADLAPIIATIEAHDAIERKATSRECDSHGEIIRYNALKDVFTPNPEPKRCGFCRFRSICGDGKACTDGAAAQAL